MRRHQFGGTGCATRTGARWVAASVLFAATAAARPAAVQPGGPPGPPHTFAAFIRPTLDTVAALAGLAPLGRARPWPVRVREVRLYLGFGIEPPDRALRLRATAGGVEGWYGHWWRQEAPRFTVLVAPGEDRAAAQRNADAEQRTRAAERLRVARTRWGCARVVRAGVYAGCAVALPGRRWDGLLAAFDRLGLARLTQTPQDPGLDGTTLVVEVRDAAGYRVYSYWEPAPGTPEGRVATALQSLAPPHPARP